MRTACAARARWCVGVGVAAAVIGAAWVPALAAVELQFVSLAWQPSTVGAVEEIVAEWNRARPDIQVRIIWQAWEHVNDFLLTSFRGGDAPDIFHQDSIMAFEYGVMGFAAPLNAYLDPGTLADIPEESWDGVRDAKGNIYGIPFLQEILVVFYNKAMFARAGITVPADGMVTWDELRDYAKRLTVVNPGGEVTTWGLFAPLEQRLWWCLVFQNGGQVLRTDPEGRWFVDICPRAREAIRFYTDLVTVYRVMPEEVISYDFMSLFQGFLGGRYAMFSFGVWLRSWLQRMAPARRLEWGMLQVRGPMVNVTEANPQAIGLWSGSRHKREAVEFMTFFTNTKNSARVALADWLFPVRRSALEQPEFRTTENQWDVAYRWLPYARDVRPKMFGFLAWEWRSMIPHLELAILGEMTLDQALEKATRDGNAFLRRLGLQ